MPTPQASRIIRPDVGDLIDRPGIRFRVEVKIMLRGFSSSLFHWLTVTVCASRRVHFRRKEAEFPAAPSRYGGTCNLKGKVFVGWRAADCVPKAFGALRPSNKLINIEDQHELSFIRETLAPPAWPLATTRRTFAPPRRAPAASQENILATDRGIFWNWTGTEETCSGVT